MKIRIDSSTFEILEGHNNSQRNPFPRRDMIPKFVDAGAFHVSYSFLENLVHFIFLISKNRIFHLNDLNFHQKTINIFLILLSRMVSIMLLLIGYTAVNPWKD